VAVGRLARDRGERGKVELRWVEALRSGHGFSLPY
jgi:hypothetical protein